MEKKSKEIKEYLENSKTSDSDFYDLLKDVQRTTSDLANSRNLKQDPTITNYVGRNLIKEWDIFRDMNSNNKIRRRNKMKRLFLIKKVLKGTMDNDEKLQMIERIMGIFKWNLNVDYAEK